MSKDVAPVRNRELDRKRVAERLSRTPNFEGINRKRRYHVQYRLGDFVLMHRDSQMHISKIKYKYLEPYEVLTCSDNGRYEIKKAGASVTTMAAKKQLRRRPTQWSLNCAS